MFLSMLFRSRSEIGVTAHAHIRSYFFVTLRTNRMNNYFFVAFWASGLMHTNPNHSDLIESSIVKTAIGV